MAKPVIYVTGFGPFQGHTVNPSQLIIEQLKNSNLDTELDVELCTDVYNVCYKEAESVSCQWEKLCPRLVVHIGVSALAKGIVLEKQAFNSNYEKVDVNGCSPETNTCCKGGVPILETSLDLEKAKSELECMNLPKLEFSISKDPGRYLCGFIYYKSLSVNNQRSLFVHIPTPESLSSDTSKGLQYVLEGIKAVIKVSYKQVKGNENKQTKKK